jgi:hypothetical protein
LLLPLAPWGRGTRCNKGITAKSEMNVSVILTELDSSSQMKRSNCVMREMVLATRENNPRKKEEKKKKKKDDFPNKHVCHDNESK